MLTDRCFQCTWQKGFAIFGMSHAATSRGYPSKAGQHKYADPSCMIQQRCADLSCMSKAPAWPPSPLNCTRKEAGAAMAVTTPICSPSRSSKGPCSMCSSTKADTLPGATFVLSRMSCSRYLLSNLVLVLVPYLITVHNLHTGLRPTI